MLRNKKTIIVGLCTLAICGFAVVFVFAGGYFGWFDGLLGSSEPAQFDNDASIKEPEMTEDEIEAKEAEAKAKKEEEEKAARQAKVDDCLAKLNLERDLRDCFNHGPKPADKTKYIVLHETEDNGIAKNIANYWQSAGLGVASHFIINKDGSILQCVDMENIAHHAGFGDNGHNDKYGVVEDGRDDMVGSGTHGSWNSDYGMNAWSIGIEIVHRAGQGEFVQAELDSLDNLIAYIDAYYGFECQIIDHNDWRSGNSDMPAEFDGYMKNYQSIRRHA